MHVIKNNENRLNIISCKFGIKVTQYYLKKYIKYFEKQKYKKHQFACL